MSSFAHPANEPLRKQQWENTPTPSGLSSHPRQDSDKKNRQDTLDVVI
jgi:hypothetical protein